MDAKSLQKILKDPKRVLTELQYADLQNADLQNADLQYADLRNADLQNANFDFSCFPLWCGSFGTRVSKELVYQLAYHICKLNNDDQDVLEIQSFLAEFANKSHILTAYNLPKIVEE